MAERLINIERLNYLHPAISQLPVAPKEVRAEWDYRLAKYLRLEALQEADLRFGPNYEALTEVEGAEAQLAATHGKDWRSKPELASERNRLQKIVEMADDVRIERLVRPYWQAARDLAVVPAPDLPALLFKIELIDREELHIDGGMPSEAWEIVTLDMARLSAGEA